MLTGGGDAPGLNAVIRSIVHTASHEIRGGRIRESEAEATLISTILGAISGHGGRA